jgi:hypothetical protein
MMSRSTGLALVAIGAILSLAVQVPLRFLDLRLTGLVLMITGLAGLRVPQRACRWLRRHRDEFRAALDRFTEPLPPSPRVPLDELLEPQHATGAPASRRG